MSWNYRVIKENYPDPKDGSDYAIYEVYYDDEGNIKCWSIASQEPYGNTLEELENCVDKMKEACHKPVLQEIETPEGETKLVEIP